MLPAAHPSPSTALMLAGMAADRPPDASETIEWLTTFCLVVVAVVLAGILAGALLRGSGLR